MVHILRACLLLIIRIGQSNVWSLLCCLFVNIEEKKDQKYSIAWLVLLISSEYKKSLSRMNLSFRISFEVTTTLIDYLASFGVERWTYYYINRIWRSNLPPPSSFLAPRKFLEDNTKSSNYEAKTSRIQHCCKYTNFTRRNLRLFPRCTHFLDLFNQTFSYKR